MLTPLRLRTGQIRWLRPRFKGKQPVIDPPREKVVWELDYTDSMSIGHAKMRRRFSYRDYYSKRLFFRIAATHDLHRIRAGLAKNKSNIRTTCMLRCFPGAIKP